MTNPTSNFGWQMPTSTDLVTDLPADFETFGQAVDTSLADLKGGTTGQVLSKASNTDMDFTWVAQDDSNAIQNAIVDAKGDLIAASAADTPARLAVGNNGESLVADSSTSTGLRYQGSMAAGKNAVINGDFDVWQRSTSSTANGTYNTADRWWNYSNAGTTTWSRESTIVPTGSLYSMKIAQAGSTSTNTQMNQVIETLNATQYAGKTITLSAQFCASASTNVYIAVSYSTSTDVAPTGSWTGITAASGTSNATSATTASFTQLSAQYAIPSTAKSLLVLIGSSSVAAGTNVYVGKVQFELGSVGTAFTRAGATIQGELAACQRYYYRSTSTASYQMLSNFGTGKGTTQGLVDFKVPATMRTTPTSVDFANVALYDYTNAALAITALTIDTYATPADPFLLATVASGVTALRAYGIVANGTIGAYVGVSAEL